MLVPWFADLDSQIGAILGLFPRGICRWPDLPCGSARPQGEERRGEVRDSTSFPEAAGSRGESLAEARASAALLWVNWRDLPGVHAAPVCAIHIAGVIEQGKTL